MLSDQEDDDKLRCDICTECFDDAERKPKMLVCHHTFCLHCLAEYGINKQAIPCPACRTPTTIGKNGVAALQDNRELQSLVHEAQLLASSVFYSDDSDDESTGDKKKTTVALWCENCLKIAGPICMAVHETSYLGQGIKHLTRKVESSLGTAKQILAEHALLFETHIDNLLMMQEACTVTLATKVEEKINKYAQSLTQIQNQMDSLCLQLNDKEPAALVEIFHKAEKQCKQVKENNKLMSQQLNFLNNIRNCSISVQCPENKQTKRESISITFKLHELPKDHEVVMTYVLHQMLQRKISKRNIPEPQVPSQIPNTNWHQVRGRREKRNSLSGNSRASSQDSLVALPSSRALSVDSRPVASPSGGIAQTTIKCFFDLTVNDRRLGRVIIQLRPDVAPKMCSNFVALCVGHKGYGYKGSKIFKVQNNDHIIGGDFEKNDGSGGHSIYKKERFFLADKCGLKDELGAIRMRGMGMDESTGLGLIGSQFHIWVRKRFFRPYPRTLVIGKVVEGLELCQEISRMKSVKTKNGSVLLLDNVVINECGKL
ncbi:uncharacterized protein [Anabrus simplex]|uniref:uncharacterized protein n=1 Tax=Anabrus simplex TaxID=316456 RepID=UPI0035A395C5